MVQCHKCVLLPIFTTFLIIALPEKHKKQRHNHTHNHTPSIDQSTKAKVEHFSENEVVYSQLPVRGDR